MTAYYHGGATGRQVGDLLLPPAETGIQTTFDFFQEQIRLGRVPPAIAERLDVTGVYRKDRVYVSTLLEQAFSFAQHWIPPGTPLGTNVRDTHGGAIYRVVAHDCEWEPDPDNMDPVQTWWCCERALVVEVVNPAVPRQTREEFERAYQAELARQGLGFRKVGPRMAIPKKRRR